MNLGSIIKATDHTMLAVNSTLAEIKRICDEAAEYGTASVCIPPIYVSAAKDFLYGRIPVCTVIGFPNGYIDSDVKVFETRRAIESGADEIDMVISVCDMKNGNQERILSEIKAIKEACGNNILKVIIEACLLSDDEKKIACELVTLACADYIKTSTGFSTGGATESDIILFKKHIGPNVKIKAAGGIKSLEMAERFLELGCSRLGSSSIINMVKAAKSGLKAEGNGY